ncbi:MAG: PRC-barrel domain-containing protein [Methanobrevibacter sp.]|nr:PRC-barrel domain-containing protein [Methanobrevibacter sp.]
MLINKFNNKDIFTITGHYFGKVKDIILNLKTGKVSKISVLTHIDFEKIDGNKGILDIIMGSLDFPDETPTYTREDLLNIEYDKIIAIGDVLLVNLDLREHEPYLNSTNKLYFS